MGEKKREREKKNWLIGKPANNLAGNDVAVRATAALGVGRLANGSLADPVAVVCGMRALGST